MAEAHQISESGPQNPMALAKFQSPSLDFGNCHTPTILT